MNNIEFNYRQNSKIPINRNQLFFSEESFQFEVDLALDYIAQDIGQTIILYEVQLVRNDDKCVVIKNVLMKDFCICSLFCSWLVLIISIFYRYFDNSFV